MKAPLASSLLAACILIGCGGSRSYLKTKEGPVLYYERSMCFGPCPAFRLEVDPNGKARFNGRANVSPMGQHQGTWPLEWLESLADEAHAIGFADKAGTYDNPLIMDLPSTRVTFGPHRVLDRVNGPDLGQFYAILDSLIAATEWVPAEQP